MTPLAAIFGTCALLLCPGGHARSEPVRAFALLAQSSQNQPANAAQQDSAAQQEASPSDEKKPADQPAPQSSKPCREKAAPDSAEKANCPSSATAASGAKKHTPAHKAAANSGLAPAKTVVRHGSTNDAAVDLSPSGTEHRAPQTLQSTNQLLATSDANLKKLTGRQLSSGQQDTVNQIKSYMEQAKKAADSGDVQRAYNLAFKANLLSADLAGH
jgi:hypothetical protein